MRKWFVLLACYMLATPALADETPVARLTLERLFASPNLNGAAPRALKLSPDGKLLTSLRARPDDRERFDLWAVDTSTGAARMLVDSLKIGSGAELSEAEKMQRERARIGGTKGIVAYDWAPDSQSLLVPLDGDIFVAGLDGSIRRLTTTPAGELDATISPKGRFVSFVRDQNLFVTDLATGAERRLTRDGGDTLSWGIAEFVAQEEMDRRRGHWWSPDDRRIAVARVDESGVALVSRVAIGADGSKVFDQRYPRAGAANAKVDLYIMASDGTGIVKADLGKNPDIYLARVDWSPDGKALYVQRESRDQRTLDLLRVDPATGVSTTVFTERSKTWINLNDDFRAMADGSILWTSERDGYAHIYRYASGKWTQLTSGKWVVTGLIGVDELRNRLFFTGNRDGVLEQHVYAVDVARPGVLTRLTEPGWWNAAVMDKSATRMITSRSNRNQPPQTYLADADGKRLSWIEENAVVAGHPYFPFMARHRDTVFGTLDAADGTLLHWQMITPALDPGKRYPVFMSHYGGPGSQEVSRAWGGAMQQYLADHGWIVFQIDNRGSKNRGRAFEEPLSHAMGGVEVNDQLAGANWLKAQPFVDPARIATFGWSYGGYMSLKMLAANQGVYAAAIAVAPVTKWELYDTHYTERYLGSPVADPKTYARSDALDDAPRIADPLLVIHGMADDNVLFENTTALMAAMQRAGSPFETMVYPGQTHTLSGPGISLHLWRTIFSFLDRTVLKKP